jgi:hypothetical protein
MAKRGRGGCITCRQWEAHVCSGEGPADNCKKEKVLLKNSILVSKNAEFHADFESVEKVLQKLHQKTVIRRPKTICEV